MGKVMTEFRGIMKNAVMLVLMLFLVACSDRPVPDSQKAGYSSVSSAQATLEFPDPVVPPGFLKPDVVYYGVLPCADCPGIETTVTIHDGDRYTLTTRYQVGGDIPVDENGRFTRHEDSNRIVLDNGQQFKLGHNTLLHLDQEGGVITGALAEHYVLQRIQ